MPKPVANRDLVTVFPVHGTPLILSRQSAKAEIGSGHPWAFGLAVPCNDQRDHE